MQYGMCGNIIVQERHLDQNGLLIARELRIMPGNGAHRRQIGSDQHRGRESPGHKVRDRRRDRAAVSPRRHVRGGDADQAVEDDRESTVSTGGFAHYSEHLLSYKGNLLHGRCPCFTTRGTRLDDRNSFAWVVFPATSQFNADLAYVATASSCQHSVTEYPSREESAVMLCSV